jgi:hypothetical protein
MCWRALYKRALARSDTLGMFLLNGRRSDIYQYTRRLEVTGAGGQPIEYVVRWQTAEAELLAVEDDVDEGAWEEEEEAGGA